MKPLVQFFYRLAVVAVLTPVFVGPAPAQSWKRVERSDFGTTRDGLKAGLVTLRNARGMSAQIISYGAIIKDLEAPDRNGNFTNILLSAGSMKQYQGGFNGAAAVIGRVANRIANAQFELDGVIFKLTPNSGKNTIHGGIKGFAQAVWTIEGISANEHEASVRLTYLSKDGDGGFPGNLQVAVTYTLTDHNELRLGYEAKTDKPTIVNLTNHAYWNLAGGGSCLNDVLEIPADRYTPADAGMIPTGEILPLEGTPMDFRRPTRIGNRIEQLKPQMTGYDHDYILGEDKVMKLAARLWESGSGRVLEVRTTQPAVQLYTGNHLGHIAVCLETQHYPDAIHHPNFLSIVIRPGELFQETTVYAFLTDRGK